MSPPITPPPARPRRASATMQIVVVLVALVVAALGHVHLHLQVLQAGYDLSRETHLHRELSDQNQKFRLELDTRRDPSVIERRARTELRMAPPDPAAIRTLHVAPARAAPAAPAVMGGTSSGTSAGAPR